MPSKVYCSNVKCAEPILYELTKPIICPFCGTNLNGNISIASQKSQPKIVEKTLEKLEIEEIDEEDISPIQPIKTHKLFGQQSKKPRKNRNRIENEDIEIDELDIDSLQLDTPIDTKKEKGVKFEELAFQKKTGFERPKVQKVDKKKAFQEFLAEATSDRKGIEINDPNPE